MENLYIIHNNIGKQCCEIYNWLTQFQSKFTQNHFHQILLSILQIYNKREEIRFIYDNLIKADKYFKERVNYLYEESKDTDLFTISQALSSFLLKIAIITSPPSNPPELIIFKTEIFDLKPIQFSFPTDLIESNSNSPDLLFGNSSTQECPISLENPQLEIPHSEDHQSENIQKSENVVSKSKKKPAKSNSGKSKKSNSAGKTIIPTDLKKEISEIKLKYASLQRIYSNLEKKYQCDLQEWCQYGENVKEYIKKLNKENSDLKKQIWDLKVSVKFSINKEEIESITGKNEQYAIDLKDKEHEIANLKNRIQEFQHNQTLLKKKIEELNHENDLQRTNMKNFEEEINDQEKQISEIIKISKESSNNSKVTPEMIQEGYTALSAVSKNMEARKAFIYQQLMKELTFRKSNISIGALKAIRNLYYRSYQMFENETKSRRKKETEVNLEYIQTIKFYQENLNSLREDIQKIQNQFLEFKDQIRIKMMSILK